MDGEGLKALYAHNSYANNLVLGVVARLSDEELRRESSPSHGSAYALLRHMLLAEAFFLAAAQARPLDVPALATFADLPPFVERLARDSTAFLASATQPDLDRVVPIRLRERAFQFPVWQLLVQALTHSIHHRGELSIVLSNLGYPLPTLDIIIPFAEQSGQPWGT